MYFRQQGSRRQPKRPTPRDSRLLHARSTRRAAPLPAATAAAPEAEAAATPEAQPAEERTRWQTLRCIIKRRHLYTGNLFARRVGFRVGCAGCDDELPVALVDALDDPELLERQTALMLACGHVFCYDCLERARDDDHRDGRTFSCPVCEAEMQCRQCGHLPRWEPIPRSFAGPQSVDEVPLTALDGGASPFKCASCMASEAWMAEGEEDVVVRVLRDEEREELCGPIDAEVRRLLYRVMDDMEKRGEVEVDAEDVLARVRELAANNVAAVWEQRRDYLARREGVDKMKSRLDVPCGTAGAAGLAGLESFTDQLLDGMTWEDWLMMGGYGMDLG